MTSTPTAAPTWRSPASTPTPSRSCSETAPAASEQRPTSPPAQAPSQSPQPTSTPTVAPTWRSPTACSDTVSVLLGTGDRNLRRQRPTSPPAQSPRSVTTADFNTDGRPDLAVANAPLQHRLGPARRRHRQLRGKDRLPHRRNPRSVTTADFNGDGRPDLAVSQLPKRHRHRLGAPGRRCRNSAPEPPSPRLRPGGARAVLRLQTDHVP